MTEPDTLALPPSEEIRNAITRAELNALKEQRSRNRMTVVETITYEREDGEPFQVQTKVGRPIEQDTQPYQREIKIGEEWKPIDLGWATEWDKIGTISIKHLGEKPSQKVLTPEERAEIASKTLLVGLESLPTVWLEYFPLDSFRAILSDARGLRIRSSKGTIRLLLTIFPA